MFSSDMSFHLLMLLLFPDLFRSWEELAQILDENKMHDICFFGPLEVL